MKYLITFHTHAGAVRFERLLSKEGLDCELMPVPRKLSSSCGVCARFDAEKYRQWEDEDVDSIYLVENKEYQLIYHYD